MEKAAALTPQNIVDEVKASGLRGRGGAAFPAGIKWQTVLDEPHGQQKYVVCNADYGMGHSLGTLPIQLAGNIKQGGLIELAFGVTLRKVLEDFGAGTFTGRPIKAVQACPPPR